MQGRPLRRWSCADLVQSAVALAHARIDERLLLKSVYEESVYRLMEGSSSSGARGSADSGEASFYAEDRRTFHPWERIDGVLRALASIFSWYGVIDDPWVLRNSSG